MVVQEEDLHALLVKAWETKVFPVIQRRFRNDQERKSGLEQIKGALQLGMEGIAQETVEFLYEENGGAPKDLHLPTMDDVKADLGKFTISKVGVGLRTIAYSWKFLWFGRNEELPQYLSSVPASTRESVRI